MWLLLGPPVQCVPASIAHTVHNLNTEHKWAVVMVPSGAEESACIATDLWVVLPSTTKAIACHP